MNITLEDIFNEYMAAKIRTGMTSGHGFPEIRKFLNYLSTKEDTFLVYQDCTDWLKLRRATLSDYALQERYHMLRAFSVWANTIDSRHQIFPKRKRRITGRRTPIILKPGQAQEIIQGLENWCEQRPFSGKTYSVLTGLLYVTGMRVSEAYLHLRDQDVDLDGNYIYVRASKAARDRYIPITNFTANTLRKYRAEREARFPGQRDRFFMLHHGTPKTTHGFRKIFNLVTADLGYRSKTQKGYQSQSLRPHDFRHSYATNMLIKFHRMKLDVKSEITKLSIILGHQSIRETYWYIEAVPELLTLILKRQKNSAAIKPEFANAK